MSHLDRPLPRCASSMNTSASNANVDRSVTTRANPTCAVRCYTLKQSEFAIARSTIARGIPADQ
jgi:hypothetical protein